MRQAIREKPLKSRPRRRIALTLLILLGLVVLFVLYTVGGYFYMAYKVGEAGVPNPHTPYLETVQGQGQGALTLTVLGDSTAIGAGATSARLTFPYLVMQDKLLPKYATVKYNNRAVSGYRARDIVTYTLNDAVKDQPDLVFISIGTNDVTSLTETARYIASLKTVLDRLTAETPARIVVLGIPAVNTAPLLVFPYPQFLDIFTRRLIKAENTLLSTYPAGRILPVELYNSVGPTFARQPGLFATDGYHPNDQGYAVWAKEVEKVLS